MNLPKILRASLRHYSLPEPPFLQMNQFISEVRLLDVKPASLFARGDDYITRVDRLPTPQMFEGLFPIPYYMIEHVMEGRDTVQAILAGEDSRFLVIVGPCSIHDPQGAIEYATKLAALKKELNDRLFIVMRVYFQKPRTTMGWKGLINNPRMDGTCDMEEGLRVARRLLLEINDLGLHAATEFLDPIVPQYIAGLITWAAIGARTTESQTHREMASGLSMPVGFKNAMHGSFQVAIDAMISARLPHSFLGIDSEGHIAVVRTTGNPDGMIVLRGGHTMTNYDPDSIKAASEALRKHNLPEVLLVDCSHANSAKQHGHQASVWASIVRQRQEGNRAIIGAMLESYIKAGNQSIPKNLHDLQYGVSVTDECMGWETTEELLRWGHEHISFLTQDKATDSAEVIV